MSETNERDLKGKTLVVIGAGPGGYPAAFRAAQMGFDTILVDLRPEPGGVCLFEGCIPSKTLLHEARLLNEAREAEERGLAFSKPRIDVDRIREHLRKVVGDLTGGLAARRKKEGIRYVRGKASFSDSRTLAIEAAEDGDDDVPDEIAFDYAVIATGSHAVELPDFDVDRSAIWDASEALDLAEIPKTLLVVGGGYIGLEMGTAYGALGSRVTVVEMTGGLLPGVDRDLVEPLERRLRGDGVGGFEEIFLRTRVEGAEPYEYGIEVRLTDAEGETRTRKFERVLTAVGRRPNSEGLGLRNTAISLGDGGFIPVDEQRRTAESHIFAIGDVAGEPMLAHVATHEARVAIEAAAGRPTAFDPAAVPAVVFTDPEIAWAGLTEGTAKEAGIDVEVARFPWVASGRARSMGRTDGVTKLVVDPRTDRILGVGVAGSGAGELIGEGALAVEMGARVEDLARTIHPHPTLSETLMEAADVYFGQSVHYQNNKLGGAS
ncbi:MAG: dihydrolipoyl dehydrogenase [Verrucomicrobiales bacterium]